MSDFAIIRGFEEVWRPAVGGRRTRPEAPTNRWSETSPRARLARLAARAPEVLVKVTGRTRDSGHLRSHLNYISRNGGLALEDRDGRRLEGRQEVRGLAHEWGENAMADSRRRANTPISLSLVLSMPRGTPADRLLGAARAFAAETFAARHDYVLALHTDADHPHVHLTVRALGDGGERLNPKKADLEAWRQAFARRLRERGVEAEATPRRARGQALKAERAPVRKMRERYERGEGAAPRVLRSALQEAGEAAFLGDAAARPWETATARRQAQVRALYLAQARLLIASGDRDDQALGRAVERFVAQMPTPDSRRLSLARALRAANRRAVEPTPASEVADRPRRR